MLDSWFDCYGINHTLITMTMNLFSWFYLIKDFVDILSCFMHSDKFLLTFDQWFLFLCGIDDKLKIFLKI